MPIKIELPAAEGQFIFNLKRWQEVLADVTLSKLPHRIETDRYGHIVMSPPPAFFHSRRQGRILGLMWRVLPEGEAMPECPLSTSDGVKPIDVAWLSKMRQEHVQRPLVLERAPEICVEIISPSNSVPEIREKQALYFEAGAQEVWTCDLDGKLSFYVGPESQAQTSHLCPSFPEEVG